MWLVVVDTTQIQPYIFGSNRLSENVGASYLVDAATGDWALEAVKKVAPGNSIGPKNDLRDDGDARIENGLVDAEVLYSGGGNFVVLFSDKDKAKGFHAELSRRALLEAPGLQLVIAQQEMEWHKNALHEQLDEVFLHTLAAQKRNRVWSAPLLGLGVTASCRSTGLPATGITESIRGEPGYLASDETLTKVHVARPQQSDTSKADERLQKAIPLPTDDYIYPSRFEDLGATAGEYSHIAVVHADGDNMSQHIREIGKKYPTADGNRGYVLALRNFSLKVRQAAEEALKTVVGQVRGIDEEAGKFIVYEPNRGISIRIKLANKGRRYYIPFRPIVFGGDDVTFVCDGRLGLALATLYLREFEKNTVDARLGKDGKGLTACAGIAIVKSHYPFARAYALAADLTTSAKSYRRDLNIAGSCLDWHFALSGLSTSIEEIREREYHTNTGSLTLRPVTLRANPNSDQVSRAWPVVRQGIDAFQKKEWAERRNKIKALRDALREGRTAVEHFILTFNNKTGLPSLLPGMEVLSSTGWNANNYCGYFDAIELVDWFIPLEEEGEADATPATSSVS